MELSSFDPLISAELVYDYANALNIPEKLKPRDPNNEKMAAVFATQFKGTQAENLMELAGRTCYDSAGTGRDSANFHSHLIQVNHGSVWAHLNVTLEFNFRDGARNDVDSVKYALACLNRPGVHVRIRHDTHALVVTANVRSIREWLDYEVVDEGDALLDIIATNVGFHFNKALWAVAPALAQMDVIYIDRWCEIAKRGPLSPDDHFEQSLPASRVIEPETDEEKWMSFLITGSRGLSHELVRHGFRSAISQRSTRYVDEDTSPWVEHPLITAFRADPENRGKFGDRKLGPMTCISQMQGLYQQTVGELEPWLISKGVDKASARKQARGAARGYLGNALYTEVIYSASVAQWKRILRQRGNAGADLEIMTLAARALPGLQASRYGNRFAGFRLEPSPLKIGNIVVEFAPEAGRRK